MSKKNSVTFYIRNSNGFPIACVNAFRSPESGGINVGISVHNPNDRFDKKIARRVAEGRARALEVREATNRTSALWLSGDGDLSGSDVFERIKRRIVNAHYDGILVLPKRVVKILDADIQK